MYCGKKKAVTFSFDDGTTQDIRLVELLNRYDLKATFNLNSGLLGSEQTLIRGGVSVAHNKLQPRDVPHIYQGHEIAAHSCTHPLLTQLTDDQVAQQVEEDRLALSELAGYQVVGFAYPGGGYDDRVVDILRQRTGIRYARTVETTLDFTGWDDLYRYRGTVDYYNQWQHLPQLAERFLQAQEGVLYLWGHSFELDIYPQRWQQFADFCRLISGQEDVFYGTNRQVLLRR